MNVSSVAAAPPAGAGGGGEALRACARRGPVARGPERERKALAGPARCRAALPARLRFCFSTAASGACEQDACPRTYRVAGPAETFVVFPLDAAPPMAETWPSPSDLGRTDHGFGRPSRYRTGARRAPPDRAGGDHPHRAARRHAGRLRDPDLRPRGAGGLGALRAARDRRAGGGSLAVSHGARSRHDDAAAALPPRSD